MEFLLNNPAIAFIFLVVAAFTVLMAIKIGTEINLNSLLKLKHKKMRISMPETHIKSRISWLTLAAITPAVFVAVLLSVGLNQDYEYNNLTRSVTSLNDITSIFEEYKELHDTEYRYFNIFERSSDFADFESVMDTTGGGLIAESPLNDGTGSSDHSETNNQVSGVDEMDSVITDGLNIYSYYRQKVTISRAFTTDEEYQALEKIHEIDYQSDLCEEDQFFPSGIYVDDSYLIVVGNYTSSYNCGDDTYGRYEYWYWYQNNDHPAVKVYDIASAEKLDEYNFDGYFKGTRKVDNNLFIITTEYLAFDNEDFLIEENIPAYSVNGDDFSVGLNNISYVKGTTPNSFTTFYGIDLDTGEIDSEVILGDGSYNIYVSNYNIYIEGVIYNYYSLNDFVNIEEPYTIRTAINKISFEGNDLSFVATGYVEGNTLDQFSLDEYNGFLRVATSEGWGNNTVNRITTLDSNMRVISVLDKDLGETGERIMSSRFVGDFGYVVTFLQMDPFYTIDLSDPYNPKIIGALKIPGFSSYLQPLDDNYMFGIGFGDNTGGTSWIKLSVYDISDKYDPTVAFEVLLDDEEYGYGFSSAAYEHKDLLIDLEKGIVAIPFASYDYNSDNEYKHTSGALVFDLDLDSGFEFNGFVSHSLNSEYDVNGYKSEFIDKYLYVVSNKYISVSELSDTENILKIIEINKIVE